MLNIMKWNQDERSDEVVHTTHIYKRNDDGTFQVWWANKGIWSKPKKEFSQHLYDKLEEITEQEAFIEIL